MRILIAVAWPYASGPRHLGHLAGAHLPADVVARYHRLAGDEVLMVSGSDQHGTPITIAAERAGVPIGTFADQQHEAIAASFADVGISFDLYTKTSTELHHRTVQRVFLALHSNGYVQKDDQQSAWCPAEGRSLPDRYVEGMCPHCGNADARGDQCDSCGRTLDPEELKEPRCSRCGQLAEFRPLRQLFLRLDLLQPAIERYLDEFGPRWRPFVQREARGWVRAGLRPRAITRDLDWGVPVPLAGWEERRLYVWFDAVIGYLSASVEWSERVGDPGVWRTWWHKPDALHRYFIGKDNGPFHAVWWPSILLGSGDLHVPDDIVANHHLTLGGAQMSASRGHGFTIDEAVKRVGVDPLRHALCAINPETADTEFTWKRAEELTRTGLLGSIANPAHRVATLLWKRFQGRVDEECWRTEATSDRERAGRAVAEIGVLFREARLREAVERIHDLGRTVNRRLASTEPWHLPDDQAHRELTRLIPYLDALGLVSYPVVPETAGRVRELLRRPREPRSWTLDPVPPTIAGLPEPPLQLEG